MTTLARTGKPLLNALAFANVSNLGEFEALLRQIPPAPPPERAQEDDPPVADGSAKLSIVPAITRMRQAL